MAEEYADLLVRDGLDSVALLGWSMGGLVAHAVSEALEASGRRVAFVGMIDPRTLDFSDKRDDDVRFARRALAHEPESGANDTESRVALYLRHFSLVRDHRPAVVAAPLYIWWADRGPTKLPWQEHTRARATERVAGGTHFSIMTPPYIDRIANDIAAAAAAATVTESCLR
jgi:thioesterase domain-containing protein